MLMWVLVVGALAHAPRAPAYAPLAPHVGARGALGRAAPRATDVVADAHRLDRARARVAALRREAPPGPAQHVAPPARHVDVRPAAEMWVAPASEPPRRTDQPSVEYDAEESARTFARQPLRVLRRQLQLALPLGAFALSVILDQLLRVERQNRARRAAQLLALISSCGPAVIKAGQALSSRSDLLPAEYLAQLQRLQDDVPPFPNEVAFRVLEQELGVPPSELFSSISAEPVAAASLGQVYRAVRRSSAQPLAIKIQRPGSLAVALLDLHILRGCAGVLNRLIGLFERDVDVVGVIDDFGTMLLGELDYTKEAANAIRFAALYASSADKVGAPVVFPELTTRRVLVEGWVEGVRLTDREGLARLGLQPGPLVQTLVRCSLKQMLDDGFFHADPHLGNLLVTADGTLTYIDFGMVSHVSREQRLGLIEAVVHLVSRDFVALASLYKELGFIPQEQPIEPIVSALNAALPDALDSPVSELNLRTVVGRLGRVMFEFPFALPPFYTAVIRCLGVLEGVALQADAGFPVIRAAYPFVAAKLLTDPSPRLQAALLDLLSKKGRDGRSGPANLPQLVGLLQHALGEADALQLAEQLAAIYLSPQHAPLVRELMGQAVDMLDYLGSRAPELADATVGGLDPPVAGGGGGVARAEGPADAELRQTAAAVQHALAGVRQVAAEIAGGSPAARARAQRLARALLSEPMGQQFALEFALKLSERAAVRGAGALMGWPAEQMPGAHLSAEAPGAQAVRGRVGHEVGDRPAGAAADSRGEARAAVRG